jgi:hypothetical protein
MVKKGNKSITSGIYTPKKRLEQRLLWSGLAGLIFGLFKLLVVVLVFQNLPYVQGYEQLRNTMPLAAFFTGSILWWLLVSRAKTITIKRGFWVGALIGLVSILTASYLIFLFYPIEHRELLWYSMFLQILLIVLFRSFSMVLIVGWATVPISGLIGGIMASLQVKKFNESRIQNAE